MAEQKTNTERLNLALQESAERGCWHSLEDTSYGVDARYDRGDLDTAIDKHLIPLSSIIEPRPAKAMFLRTAWATGTTDDGREFEVAVAGTTLILSIGPFDDSREVYTIALTDLAPAWLRAVGAGS